MNKVDIKTPPKSAPDPDESPALAPDDPNPPITDDVKEDVSNLSKSATPSPSIKDDTRPSQDSPLI